AEEGAQLPPLRIEGIELEARRKGRGQEEGAILAAADQGPGAAHQASGKELPSLQFSLVGEYLVKLAQSARRADAAKGGQASLQDLQAINLAEGPQAGRRGKGREGQRVGTDQLGIAGEPFSRGATRLRRDHGGQ